jgi:hypothetical protein
MPPLVLRIFAVLCLAGTFWMFSMFRPEKPPGTVREVAPKRCDQYPGGFRGATLAIEFAESPEEVDCIVGLGKRGLRPALRADGVTIALYWSILTCLSLLWWRSELPGARGLGGAAAVGATASAVADLIENRGIGRLLDGSRAQDVIDGVRTAAYWKWGLLAVTFALLAWFLLRRGRWTWLHAALFLIAAGSMAIALIVPSGLPYLGTSVSWITRSLLVCVLLFLIYPRGVQERTQRT